MTIGSGIAVGCLALGVAYLAGIIAKILCEAAERREMRKDRAELEQAWGEHLKRAGVAVVPLTQKRSGN